MSSAPTNPPRRTRIKESCTSCRRMKSKCDGKKPCLPCQLRKTTETCEYASQRGDPAGETSGSVPTLLPPPQPPQPTPKPLSPPQTKPAHHHPQPLGTFPWDHEWLMIKRAIPSWTACEILLEYGIQEIDFAWLPPVRTLDLWQHAIRIEMCSPSQAGLLCMSLAMPALFISYLRPALYRPDIQPDLHLHLARLARSFLPRTIGTLDELELLVLIADYLGYAGQFTSVYEGDFGEIEMGAPLLNTALRMGLFDENLPLWEGISPDEREQRRKLSALVVRLMSWASLMQNTPPLLDGIKINVCRPAYTLPRLDGPVKLTTSGSAGFRMFRAKTEAEASLLVTLHETSHKMFSLSTNVRDYLLAFERDPNPQVMRSATRLCHLLEEMKGHLGPLDPIDYADPLSCKMASQRLVYEMLLRHLLSIILHPWLRSQWSSTNQEFVTRAQTNVREIDRLSGIIRALFNSRYGTLPLPLFATFLWSQVMSLIVWRSKLGAATSHDMLNYSGIGYPEVVGQSTVPDASPATASRADIDSIDAMFGSVHETLQLLSVAPFAATAAERVGRVVKRIQVDAMRTSLSVPNDQWAQVTRGTAQGEVFKDMWDVDGSFWKFL